ncbi:LysR family transcriptional regulator [Nonomuraea sp. SMC257]|uniref:LysR family transcriptional regulator n=1 Tax=Nonomuraea montanisoli TaxID=2741721 RepID=A0A7Y6M2A8_9ACTN|nr:LysR family transcriptional regulator [Nonomuraea montanisoli]
MDGALDVRDLRYFRAVAEERNFTRAAERLGIAQPPLSRAVRQLERRLGARLLDRSTRQVTPTAAGLVLLEEAVRVLDAVSAAAHRTRRAARATPAVVVTAKPGVATDLLRRMTRAYAAQPDAGRVEILVSGYGEQGGMVRDGRADVALLGTGEDDHGLDLEPLTTEPRVAALPAGHALAARSVLSCRDLAGLPFPHCPVLPPHADDYWWGRDAREEAAAQPGPVVRDSSQLLEAVALGQAVALVPASLAERNRRDDIAYRPVRDAGPYTLAIAWPSGSRSPVIARFVRTAIEVASHHEPPSHAAGPPPRVVDPPPGVAGPPVRLAEASARQG